MREQLNRNPVVTAFARGEKQRHQVHADRRKDRRVRGDYRPDIEWDAD